MINERKEPVYEVNDVDEDNTYHENYLQRSDASSNQV